MIFALLILIISPSSQAQPRLDRPVLLGPSDICFESAQDTNTLYCIPHELCRVGDPNYSVQNKVWQARFNVGVCKDELQHLNELLAKKFGPGKSIHFYRGILSEMDYSHFNQIPAKYQPSLQALGDPLDLYGPTPYAFTLSRIRSWWRDYTLPTLKDLLEGKSAEYLATLHYQFISVLDGEFHLSKSAIPIYTRKQSVQLGIVESNQPSDVFDRNSLTACWENPQPGRVCVKDNQK